MPFFSVITPAYNAEKFIAATIESVIYQSFSDWEMIIVDDESSDNTIDIIIPYCKADHRIKLIKQKNTKQAGARNKGVENATGEWICFLDSDDYWLPEKLAIQAQYIDFEKPDVIYTGGYIFENETNIKNKYPTLYGQYSGMQMLKELYFSNPIPIQSIAIKKIFIKKTGIQDESPDIVGCEDLDYWIRLAKNGAVFYGIESYQFMYRKHTSNISKNLFQMRLAMVSVLIKNFEKNIFKRKEIISFFYNRFDPLLMSLIKFGNIDKAKILLCKYKEIHDGIYLKINFLFLNCFAKKSFYPIKLINKLNHYIETPLVHGSNQ